MKAIISNAHLMIANLPLISYIQDYISEYNFAVKTFIWLVLLSLVTGGAAIGTAVIFSLQEVPNITIG